MTNIRRLMDRFGSLGDKKDRLKECVKITNRLMSFMKMGVTVRKMLMGPGDLTEYHEA